MTEIVPDRNSLSPAIKFQVKEQIDSNTIPITISGSVCEDHKYLVVSKV